MGTRAPTVPMLPELSVCMAVYLCAWLLGFVLEGFQGSATQSRSKLILYGSCSEQEVVLESSEVSLQLEGIYAGQGISKLTSFAIECLRSLTLGKVLKLSLSVSPTLVGQHDLL